MKASTNAKRLTCLWGPWLVLIIMVSMLFGCKMAGYGKYTLSREVEKIFTSGQVLSDHKYYYTGSNTWPDAVMGIHQNYTLDDEYWDKAKDIQNELKFWVGQINRNKTVFGYYILAPDGKQIGIYYSHWSTGWVKIGANNQVTISLPDKDGDRLWRYGPGNE